MRVIHLVKHCHRGHGNAHVAVDLACVQVSRGYQVVYASDGGDLENLLARSGVGLCRIPHSQKNVLGMGTAVFKLARLCRQFRPDLIHAHMMSDALVGYGASLLTGVPLVTTVHNSFDRHSILMRLGRCVVAVSEAERQSLLARGFSARKLQVVINGPNGSPREEDLPGDAGLDRLQAPSITTICGLHARKGVRDVIQAFATVADTHPRWTLNIVGDGPDRKALESQARDLGIGDRVNFMGSITYPRRVLERSAIFVLASYAEPCSLAVAEARAMGCAIVATAVGGTPELLDHGRAGRLVAAGRPDQIAKELDAFMRDEDRLLEWRARAKIGSDYLFVDRLFRDYDRVYRKTVAEKGVGRPETCLSDGSAIV
jgi:glycosyltransferase involved in cell wall biosynthesis